MKAGTCIVYKGKFYDLCEVNRVFNEEMENICHQWIYDQFSIKNSLFCKIFRQLEIQDAMTKAIWRWADENFKTTAR